MGLVSGEYEIPYGEAYRAESTRQIYGRQQYAVDDAFGTESRHWEQFDVGHDSWPQTYRMSRPHFAAANAPQFHPVRAEDVAAHTGRSTQDTDAIMGEVDMRAHHGLAQESHWSNTGAVAEYSPRHRKRDEALSLPGGISSAAAHMSQQAPMPNVHPSSSIGLYPAIQGPAVAAAAAEFHDNADSNGSATIVAQLASALQPDSLALDDNPFEPIPLPGRSKKKPKREGGSGGKW